MTSNILELQQVSKNFGGIVALYDVSTTVKEHQIKSIIGPNGAGKTTLFNIITGYILTIRILLNFLPRKLFD